MYPTFKRHCQLTFCSSWEPEYFAEMDFISPPNAEAHSFTLRTARAQTRNTHTHTVNKNVCIPAKNDVV